MSLRNLYVASNFIVATNVPIWRKVVPRRKFFSELLVLTRSRYLSKWKPV